MRVVAENIKDKFFQIPDVKKVELVGVQPEKIYIQMSNAKLAQLGIPIDTLASTIQAETAVTPSGMAESDSTNTYLRLTGSLIHWPISAIFRSRLMTVPSVWVILPKSNAAMLNRLNRKCTLMVSQP